MPVLYENLSKSQADLCSLVLSSSQVPFRLVQGKYGYSVWVNDAMYHRALYSMQSYFTENKETAPFADRSVSITGGSIVSSIVTAIILLIFYVGITSLNIEDRMIQKFGSSANHIIAGDWYRNITSLMLHLDAPHVFGNMIGIVIFGTAVCAVCGWGIGWLMILISGAIGNFINAFMYESGHMSIGASTAVFGAIGILSGYQLIRSRQFIKRRYAAWAPLACGLALLGLLGSGPHTDIAAHFFGFATGIGIGLFYALFPHYPAKLSYQIAGACIACFLIVIAWFIGWRAIN